MGATSMINLEVDTVDVLPILPSLNFEQTADFYVNHLGFEEVKAHCDDYRVFRRGRMELFFWSCDNPEIAMNSSVFIRAGNARQLFEEFTERGVASAKRSDDDDCGETNFHVRDPHGNLLMFLSPIAAAVSDAA